MTIDREAACREEILDEGRRLDVVLEFRARTDHSQDVFPAGAMDGLGIRDGHDRTQCECVSQSRQRHVDVDPM